MTKHMSDDTESKIAEFHKFKILNTMFETLTGRVLWFVKPVPEIGSEKSVPPDAQCLPRLSVLFSLTLTKDRISASFSALGSN